MNRLRQIIEAISAIFALVGAIACALLGLYMLWANGESLHLAELVIALVLFMMAVMEVVISRSLWNSVSARD
ncbi:hypothetical protein H7F10_07455 [Acidithiobacillus sp. HP-6]|uniref:hypothetical protein n=1 Tax=Acidithiobacillus sp. HP-6 TaxID=2697655 RepID=UPI00187956F5|nr:hypothetical protein [Acidithiobacillus sp. HP-6]MBE7562787.1 hypothetical protein [Acidithiobacillus sp. HP-6]